MDQITFSEAEYQTKKRKTRREIFLERMDPPLPQRPDWSTALPAVYHAPRSLHAVVL